VENIDKLHQIELGKATKEAGTADLGTIAKLTAKSLVEVRRLRAERFNLLKKIRAIMLSEGSRIELSPPTKFHRTSLCKHAVSGTAGVGVNRLKNANKSFYTGLQTCGSVWTCPVCSHKIQELRRIEIAHAMRHFYSGGHQALMITFTFPHERVQALDDILTRFKNALDEMRANGTWRRYFKTIDFEGLITSTEITHGFNGWHPHTHELYFVNKNLNEDEVIAFVKKQWLSACLSFNLVNEDKVEDFLKHSIDIRFNCSTSDYLAKFDCKSNWGIDREIAKASTKKGKGSGKHPFQLADENKDELFIEYVKAIKGRHQLRWSRLLKKKIGIQEISDAEAAEKEGEDIVELLGLIPKSDWVKVLDKELRAEILNLAEDNKTIREIRSFILSSETKQNE
jgi:hypothetical protein